MKARTLIRLLSLSTSLYMISKDEELMKKIAKVAHDGKERLNDLYENFTGNNEEELTEKILRTAKEAREELEKKVDEALVKIYEKMQVAHAKDLQALQNELATLKRELAIAEARIVNLENGTL